jgi:hypothetical protein
VAFDDVLYPGVARLKTEIAQDMDLYRVFPINKYQFFVTSKNLRGRERHLLGLAKGVVGAYLRVRGQGQVKQGVKASVDPGKPEV